MLSSVVFKIVRFQATGKFMILENVSDVAMAFVCIHYYRSKYRRNNDLIPIDYNGPGRKTGLSFRLGNAIMCWLI